MSVLVSQDAIRRLDLTPLQDWLHTPLSERLAAGPVLELRYDWPRDGDDPREVSECPEPRLWALRADGRCPWLPLLLERQGGSLAQHVAMLVPHTFRPGEGLRFDPQALELWITHRLILLDTLARSESTSQRGNLTLMAQSLGYELDPGFWQLLDQAP